MVLTLFPQPSLHFVAHYPRTGLYAQALGREDGVVYPLAHEIEASAVGGLGSVALRTERCSFGTQAV